MKANYTWKDYCQSIDDALLDDNLELFQCAIEAVELFIIDHCEKFPQNLFAELIHLIQRHKFFKFTDGFHLLNIFADDLDLLNTTQKKTLVKTLKEIYPQLEDSATCVVASEIVIEVMSPEDAWETLKLWMADSHPAAREILPYALSYFYDECSHETLRKRILTSLKKMTTDPNPNVQLEAEFNLKMLTHKYS